jgi:hypothetical protein
LFSTTTPVGVTFTPGAVTPVGVTVTPGAVTPVGDTVTPGAATVGAAALSSFLSQATHVVSMNAMHKVRFIVVLRGMVIRLPVPEALGF